MSEISIEDVSKRFQEHLAIEDNNRIIFSGKFGTGKTYFLNKFFDDRETEYNKFIISPANYVVSSNEDIFELIKADIIKDLFLTGKVNIKKLPEDNSVQKISDFIEGNQFVLGNFLLNTVSKLNSTLSVPKEVIDMIGEVYKKYKSHKSKVEVDNKTMSEEMADYWFATSEKIGQVYEHNYITKLINHFLNELTEKGKKKNVLIIDDLDRIDPDHIFRILNILSAHNNQFGTDNKFKFNHIIIVCDIDNIRKIFNHKYGADVDFDGYMDKFYSADYFIFRNIDAVSFYIDSFSSEFESEEEKCFIKLIYQSLSQHNILTLRKLLKHKIKVQIPSFEVLNIKSIDCNFQFEKIGRIEPNTSIKLLSTDLRILNIFKMIHISLGSINLLREMTLKEPYPSFQFIDDDTFKKAVCFLALQNHLINANDINDFIKLGGERDQQGRYLFVSRISEPSTTLFNMQFNFRVKWNNLMKYDGTKPYFESVSINLSDDRNNLSSKKSSTKDFWDCIRQILMIAKSKKYLEKIDIVI